MKNYKNSRSALGFIFWLGFSLGIANAQTISDTNTDFILTANGTCVCDSASFGESGTFFSGTPNQITYTKRTRTQLIALIDANQNDPQIALTCTSGITNMSEFFSSKDQFNQNISSWDVSNVTNLNRMFRLATSFNQPLNDWDVSNVTNADQVFEVSSSFNQPLNNWDVSNMNFMFRMFSNALVFNQPLNDWDVSSVTSMNQMFAYAGNFNQPLNNWDVSSVTNMDFMFIQSSVFNQNISNWCVEDIPTEPSNFSSGSPLQTDFKPNWGVACPIYFYEENDTCKCPDADFGNTGIVNIGGTDYTFTKRTRVQLDALIAADQNDPQIALTCTSGITDMANLFNTRNQFNHNISSWDVSNVTSMQRMFGAANAFNQPINNWDVLSVNNMSEMFINNTIFNQPINDWNVSSVINMSSMFGGAHAFNQALNNWDVSNVENMSTMFGAALSFNQPLDTWDVSNVTTMASMFLLATSFNQDISNWCVQQIANEPSSFSLSTPLETNFKPLWGKSCSDVTWTGLVDGDWNNISNWSPNANPNTTDNVVINTQSFPPIIEANTQVEIGRLIILDGNQIEITGVLKMNTDLINNGQITFISDDSKTGQLDTFTGSYSGTGNVRTERFIPAGDKEKRAFRFLSSSVNSTESIRANWQEGVNNTGTSFPTDNQNPNPGFGTHISGSLTGDNGFDATGSGDASLFLYSNNSQTWVPIDNTDVNTLAAGSAYRLMVRGNRGINLTTNAAEPTNTTLRASGNLVFGSIDMSADLAQGSDEFSFVGNPYQAVVDFSTVTKTNLRDYLYIWDASLTGENGRGAYVVVEVSSNGIVEAPAASSSTATKFIAPHQAFFVRNTNTGNPTLVFEETDKATTQAQVEVFSTYSNFYVNSRLYKTEDLQNNQTELDAIALRFGENYTTLADEEDAEKLGNPNENFAIINQGLQAIDKQNIPTEGHEVALFVNNYTDTDYSFTFDVENIPEGQTVWLEDQFLGTSTPITAGSVYAFTVDASIPASTAFSRFKLVFEMETFSNADFEENALSIYPNPAEEQFYISGLTSVAEVHMYDVLGKEVLVKDQVSNQEGIHIESLPSGVYVVKVIQEEMSFSTKLIVR